MAGKEIIRIIKSMRKKKKDDFVIKVNLQQQGYSDEDIEKGFQQAGIGEALLKNFLVLVILTLVIIEGAYSFFRIKYYGSILPENGDISSLKTDPKQVELKYFLDGKYYSLNYTAYRGLSNYLENKNRDIFYLKEKPTDKDIISKFTDNKKQSTALNAISEHIKTVTPDTDRQARIAISLVQLIPYEEGANAESPIKYPYEVLYNNEGVCSEKTYLLIFLLRELGFRTAVFRFMDEKHEAVGTGCPVEFSYMDSGYCFVETTSLSVITDSYSHYIGKGQLDSEPIIVEMSDGISLKRVKEDYNDAREIMELVADYATLSVADRNRLVTLAEKYGYDMRGEKNLN